MSTNYDDLAEIYQESKHNPIKLYSEEYCFNLPPTDALKKISTPQKRRRPA